MIFQNIYAPSTHAVHSHRKRIYFGKTFWLAEMCWLYVHTIFKFRTARSLSHHEGMNSFPSTRHTPCVRRDSYVTFVYPRQLDIRLWIGWKKKSNFQLFLSNVYSCDATNPRIFRPEKFFFHLIHLSGWMPLKRLVFTSCQPKYYFDCTCI